MVGGIVQALYQQARRAPLAPALLDDTVTLTFAEMLERVQRVRQFLQEHDVVPGARVAICCENSLECLIAMYGILDAGCAFIPLSPRDPDARLDRLCAKANPALLLASRARSGLARVRTVAIGAAIDLSKPVSQGLGAEVGASLNQAAALAYVIFTSGSTGDPKGVCISNQSFFHASAEAARCMGFDGGTRSLAILPFHFDGSFSSVFPVLMSGGSVYVNPGPICLPAKFSGLLAGAGITHTTVTPTYLRALLTTEEAPMSSWATWRTLALGGEDPPKPLLRRLRDQLPSLKFFNRYGPTEATMAVSTLEISDEMLAAPDKIPLGRPHEGVEFIALNPRGEPISVGESGELYIAGRQLMLGYLDDRAATEAVLGDFLGDQKLLLKTGDLVSINGAHQYVFIERTDNIVKRSGTRVALGEVEAALMGLQGVRAAACVKASSDGNATIIAFLQRTHGDVTERELRRDLLRELPASMSPDSIRFLDDLPRAAGGKIDRQALAKLAAEASPETAN